MSHGTDVTVECPLCGTAFDPSLSGGWCTEQECGAWRYDDATAVDSGRAMTDGGTDVDGGDGGDDEGGGGDDETGSTDADGGDGAGDDAASAETVKVKPDGDAADVDEGDGDATDEAGDASEGEDASEHEDEDASEAEDEDEKTVSCPACETEIAATDNFCRSCGADVSGIDDSGELTTCPECETGVDPADSFCRECGEHLDAHRPGTDATPQAPTAGAGQVRDPARSSGPGASSGSANAPQGGRAAPSGGANRPVGPANGNSGAANAETVKLGGGAAASTTSAGERDAASGDTGDATSEEPRLSLVARNREIEVGDGDTVGKQIRSIVMDTGGTEEDAVRVHREHVRFEREGEQFYLVDLGQNPTAVNGEELEQGDRVPVEPGDRIDLSGVARIGVRQA